MKHCLVLILVLAPAWAQDEPKPEAKAPGALLTDAILFLKAQDEVVVTADISHAKPDGKQGGVGMGGQVIVRVVGPGGTMGHPYEGKVEAWRDKEGVTVIVSESRLPGFGIYVSDERTITQVTFGEKRPALGQIEAELASLLEPDRLAKHVLAAHKENKFQATVQESGDITFRGEIVREVVRPVTNAVELGGMVVGNFGPQAKVLRAEASLVVSRQGRFKSVAIKLTRNDPTAEMLRGRGVRWGGQQGQPEKKKADKHDIEGGSTTYTLEFAARAPSEQATLFKRSMQRLLAAEK